MGAHQEEREDVEVELGLERNELLLAVAELVENGSELVLDLEVRNFGVMAILRTVRADFKNATYPDGLHSHILQYMPDDPAHALKLIFGLKFQTKESSMLLILSNLRSSTDLVPFQHVPRLP